MVELANAGQMISDRYRLVQPGEQLPYAGTQVWQAVDTLLGTSVRLVLLSHDAPATSDALDAARRVAFLDDVHIVKVLAVSDPLSQNDEPSFICTELLPGTSLSQVAEEALPPDQVYALTGEVAAILAATREKGLRHLALSPDMIRVGSGGEVYIDGVGTAAPLSGIASDSVFGTEADRMEVRGIVLSSARMLLGNAADHLSEGELLNAALAVEGLPEELRTAIERERGDEDSSTHGEESTRDEQPGINPIDSPADLIRILAPWPPVDAQYFAAPAPFGAADVHDSAVHDSGESSHAKNIDPTLGIVPASQVELHPQWVPISEFGGESAANAAEDGEDVASTEVIDDDVAPTEDVIPTEDTEEANDDSAESPQEEDALSESTPDVPGGDDASIDGVVDEASETELEVEENDEAGETEEDRAPDTSEEIDDIPETEGMHEEAGMHEETDDPGEAPHAESEETLTDQIDGPTDTTAEDAAGDLDAAHGEDLAEPEATAVMAAASLGATSPDVPTRQFTVPEVRNIDARKPSVDETFAAPAQHATRPPQNPQNPQNPKQQSRFSSSWVIVLVTFALVLGGATWAISTLLRPTDPVNTVKPIITAPPSTPAAEESGNPQPSASATPENLPAPTIASVTLLNPHADLLNTTDTSEQDTPVNLPLATDGNTSTTWDSWWYSRPDFSGKGGIGLEIKLAQKSSVNEVELLVNGSGGNVQWREGATAEQPESGSVLVEGAMSADTRLSAGHPVATDTIILWFNQLPVDSAGKYRISLAEIRVN